MAAIGVGWVLRKAGAAASSTTAITDEGKIETYLTNKSTRNPPIFDLNFTFISYKLYITNPNRFCPQKACKFWL